jgi:hypothetical protein
MDLERLLSLLATLRALERGPEVRGRLLIQAVPYDRRVIGH